MLSTTEDREQLSADEKSGAEESEDSTAAVKQRRSKRSRKRVSYAEDSDDDDSDESMEAPKARAPPRKRRKTANDSEEEWNPKGTAETCVSEGGEDDDDSEYFADTTSTTRKKRKTRATTRSSARATATDSSDADQSEWSIARKLSQLSAAGVKELVKHMKTLRTSNGDCPFEALKLGGKRDDVQCRAEWLFCALATKQMAIIRRANALADLKRGDDINEVEVGLGSVRSIRGFSSFCRLRSVKETDVPWEAWHSSCERKLKTLLLTANKTSARRGSAKTPDLAAKLAMFDKSDLVNVLVAISQKKAEMRQEIEALLPSMDAALNTLEADISAALRKISKARPYTRYGSSSDHFSYKRCVTAVNGAKRCILQGIKPLEKAKDWNSLFEALRIVARNELPVWDTASDNSARKQIAKKAAAILKQIRKNSQELSDGNAEEMQRLEDAFASMSCCGH